MNRAVVVILALGPWLASCALGPTVRTPDTRLPVAYEAPADVTGPTVDIAQWWTLYDDAQLQSLVADALAHAPDALSAEARLREATAVRAGALAAYGPQGNLQGTGTYQDT